MNGEKLTDEQLVAAFRSGDKYALDELLVRYKNRVLSVARGFFLVGADTEDLVQEGMCGLYSAILSFDGRAEFVRYANVCIRNRILDAVKKSTNGKNVKDGLLLPYSEEDGALSSDFSPEDALIGDEEKRELADVMKRALSNLEYRVISMYIEGAAMSEITAALGITYKQADNALVRAKNKLRKIKNC